MFARTLMCMFFAACAGCGAKPYQEPVKVSATKTNAAASTSIEIPAAVAAPPDASAFSDIQVKAWHNVEPFSQPLAQLPTVFWEPDDSQSMREWIFGEANMTGKRVFEIGPGTGLLALCCLQAGAEHVIAADINPYAVINTSYNADRLSMSGRIEVHQVANIDTSPFATLPESSKFDYIVSNPPWEDAPVKSLDQYALYDPGLRLCDRLLNESANWLKADGKLLLVYGSREALETVPTRAARAGWQVRQLDSRDPATLPAVFVPGIMLELTR